MAEAQKASLATLVDERNRIVHHLTDDYGLGSTDGLARLDALLDPQARRIRDAIDALRTIVENQIEARRLFAEFIGSTEFRGQLELACVQGSPLVIGMGVLATELARGDGWTVMQSAAHALRIRDPEAFTDLKARYGHDRLKTLLLASRLFELRDEPTSRGGSRLLYRPVATA